MQQSYTQIGTLGKTHGVQGSLKFYLEDWEPDVLESQKVLFVEQNGQMLPYFIQEIRYGKDLIVTFEEVTDKETAQLLVGSQVFLPEEVLPESVPATDSLQYAFLKGFLLEDPSLGEVGKIQDVIELPQQEIAVLNYRGREVMVPLHPALILDVQESLHKVIMQLPEGLLDL